MLRIGVVLVSAALAVACFPGVDAPERLIKKFAERKHQKIAPYPATEDVRKAIDYRVELSKTLFNTTLIVLGGLWSIVLAKKDEASIVFHDGIAIAILCCANVLLFSAGWDHINYVMEMSSILAAVPVNSGKVPDIDAQYVLASLLSQLFRIFAAIIVSAFALLTAKWG